MRDKLATSVFVVWRQRAPASIGERLANGGRASGFAG
jgi:hypothetical protein